MAESTFPISPGVVAQETDLSGPTKVFPSGIPAGVVGTSVRGPAFVPVTVATFQDFISIFGNSDGTKFGPIAMRAWLRKAGAGTFVRVLGAGDGTARTAAGNNQGKVTRAGFVVGDQLPQANGNVGANAKAGSTATGGILGRTYMLAAFMSETNGSTYLSEAGIQTGSSAHPILRGVLMAPSGVALGLSHSLDLNGNMVPDTDSAAFADFGTGAAENAGGNIGNVNLASSKQEFVLLLNGLKNAGEYKNIITASFDPSVGNYFVNELNKDPEKIEDAGHLLYTHYDVDPNLAVLTGTGVTNSTVWIANNEPLALLLTSSLARNVGSATSASAIGIPSFENFEDRFETAFSPYVISQVFGGSNKNLFKFYTLSDGQIGAGEFKITIANIKASAKANNKFGTFDVLVRKITDNDLNPMVLESFHGLSLDPTSNNFIAKRIGDQYTYFDFDAASGSKKIVVSGDYSNVSNFVRVQLSSDLKNGRLDQTSLPTGFRGMYHLVTSGTTPVGGGSILTGSFATLSGSVSGGIDSTSLQKVVQPPIPMRSSIAVGVGLKKTAKVSFTWGVQFEVKTDVSRPNKNEKIDSSILSFTRYFPKFHTSWENPVVGDNEGTADIGGCILDADRFNNNFFTLERVQVITGSTDRPDPDQWQAAVYRRNGIQTGSLDNKATNTVTNVRFLDATKDFAHVPTQKYLKFTFPLQGGFDGVNIFDSNKKALSDVAVRREMDDSSNQGGKDGPTVSAYRRAVDVMEAKQDVDIQLLAIPGIRHPSVTDYTVESVERRFDALYIMDIEQRDNVNAYVTSSNQIISVVNTTNTFQSRAVDSSFAAAYFPDVMIRDGAVSANSKAPIVVVPPSAVVLGAMALNDAIGHPWFAPAGVARGALPGATNSKVFLMQQNLDDLYSVDINPIVSDAKTGVTIQGQKTLLAAQSALDRVNVRRLLIDIRRKVRNVARTFLFEPNQASTVAAFSAQVRPILASVQSQGGLDRFKVKIDASTTTQADVENNTIRGRIYLQPTRSVEFVSIDFVVSNEI